MEIIARMLGVPKADRQQLREWQDRSLHRHPGSMYPDHDGIEAMIVLTESTTPRWWPTSV